MYTAGVVIFSSGRGCFHFFLCLYVRGLAGCTFFGTRAPLFIGFGVRCYSVIDGLSGRRSQESKLSRCLCKMSGLFVDKANVNKLSPVVAKSRVRMFGCIYVVTNSLDTVDFTLFTGGMVGCGSWGRCVVRKFTLMVYVKTIVNVDLTV